MKITRIITLILSAFIFATACDIDWYPDPIIIPVEGDDDKKEPTIITNITLGKTVSCTNPAGINFKYTIEDAALEVGDILKIQIDSENEIKPYVKLLIDEEEVVYTSELPTDYERIMTDAKEYSIVFSVYNSEEVHQFDWITSVTVE